MRIDSENKWIQKLMSWISHYDHDKYWRRREIVVNPYSGCNKFLKLYYLYYIKKVDSYWHCTFGTGFNEGARFEEPPTLWHGPNGIIIAYNVTIGKGCIICQRVTIGNGSQVTIGNNVLIGSNVYIKPGVKIGNNVKIGANAVVVEDIPDGATVVMQKPIIKLNL